MYNKIFHSHHTGEDVTYTRETGEYVTSHVKRFTRKLLTETNINRNVKNITRNKKINRKMMHELADGNGQIKLVGVNAGIQLGGGRGITLNKPFPVIFFPIQRSMKCQNLYIYLAKSNCHEMERMPLNTGVL